MKEDIIIFHQFCPDGNRVGGIGKYVLSFIKNTPIEYDLKLIGVCSSKESLYTWQTIEVSGRKIQFLPVCVVKNENSKALMPTTLMYVIGLLRARFKVSLNGIFFMQRSEYLVALLGLSGSKFLVVHNDILRQLDPAGSEVIWSKFPRIFRFIFKQLLKGFDHVFSVNNNSVQYIKEVYPEGNNKVSFSPTWADKDIFSRPDEKTVIEIRETIANRYFIDSTKKWLIFVGRFQKQKNIELLIESLEHLNNVHLIMAGDGNQKKDIEFLVNSKNLGGRVTFLGNVPHVELSNYIIAADVYVSSSNFEGMSVALLEALQVGTPVVTTPTGESQFIINNGINGIVTSGWNRVEYTEAVKSVLLFKHDIATSCIESISHYSSDHIIKNMLSIMVKDFDNK